MVKPFNFIIAMLGAFSAYEAEYIYSAYEAEYIWLAGFITS